MNMIWEGYIDLMKAKAYKLRGDGAKRKERGPIVKERVDWGETKEDSIVRDFEQVCLYYDMRLREEKSTSDVWHGVGANAAGELGIGVDANQSVHAVKIPTLISSLRNRVITSIACGEHHTIAVLKGFYPELYSQYPEEVKATSGDVMSDVIGWGENTLGQILGDDSAMFIETPVLIPEFIGKGIAFVAAAKSSSTAATEGGLVYEWGTKVNGNMGIEIVQKINEGGITSIKKGALFTAVLSKMGGLFVWGRVHAERDQSVVLETVKPIELEFKKGKIVGLEVGFNHLIISNTDGKVFGWGDNFYGQLGFPPSKVNCSQSLIPFETSVYSKATRIAAYGNISLILDSSTDLVIAGCLNERSKKTTEKPKILSVSPDAKDIVSLSGNGSEIYAADLDGRVYLCDFEGMDSFRPYESTKGIPFRQIIGGKRFLILKSSLLVQSELCRIINTPQPESSEEEKEKPFIVSLQLNDALGPFGIVPSTKMFQRLRIVVYAVEETSQDPDIAAVEKQLYSDLKRNKKASSTSGPVLSTYGNIGLIGLKWELDSSDASIQRLHFTVPKDGVYKIYVFVNERHIQNSPLRSKIRTALVRESEQDIKSPVHHNLEDEERKQEMDSTIRNEEMEKSKRDTQTSMSETDKRAEERLKKFMDEKKAEEIQKEKDRLMRKDRIVGGGFDLKKAPTPTPAPAPVVAPKTTPLPAQITAPKASTTKSITQKGSVLKK